MAIIKIKNLSFTYHGSYTPVFHHLNFSMDTDWRLGLVGRNGRGKTTLVRLLMGELQGNGLIETGVQFDSFPFEVDENSAALRALRCAIAPFDAWEEEMDRLINFGDELSLQRWGEIEQRYSANDGYIINSLIIKEADKMGIDSSALMRPLSSFSPGEKTRLLLSALFLRKNRFLLIDEPTNHLDMHSRGIVADYLSSKTGFLLISHDRDFLDRCVDHMMALQKDKIHIEQGNYSSYQYNKQLQDDFELQKNKLLKKDIIRLTSSSREKAVWSDKIEASKIGSHAADRGAIGHKAAKMMKRSLAIEARLQKQIEQKETLLKNIEFTAPLSLHPIRHASRTLFNLLDVCFSYEDGINTISHLNLNLIQGKRLALMGHNGVGKSTLLKLLTGALQPTSGSISKPDDLIISVLPQEMRLVAGTAFEIAQNEGVETDYFLAILRKLGFPREAFTRDARSFSMGQQKKLLLAASMAKQAHIYLWDEPLNYIDLESREQIEAMLSQTSATMVFVEHDRHFVNQVATDAVSWDEQGNILMLEIAEIQ